MRHPVCDTAENLQFFKLALCCRVNSELLHLVIIVIVPKSCENLNSLLSASRKKRKEEEKISSARIEVRRFQE